ncbi:ABC transporter substrate-binding protein [Mangrovihabitans endophyticus]|uniref:ABC transporter substrate-binding protein n=1 Tax=Mangrovihabitans endophyticus TaxID=1751298 RepID=A0A8J3C2C5_9ACTN|nr:ABC transporter substrate-binding protein [Mangrovihabitans endophyticus]GGK97169.1 ABC transporter substrate-binding protein [Mangrovihabitans endophyticus]
MFRRRLLTAATAMAALLISGCAGGDDAAPGVEPSANSAASFPVTVGSVTLDRRPDRIVSLSATATEILYAVGAGDQVTAVDQQSNHPANAPRTDLSGYKPNAEAIAAKNPDLVVISNDIDKIVDRLTTLKVPTFLAPAAATLDDTYAQIGQLGALTGHPDQAQALTTRMKSDLDKIVAGAPQRSTPLSYYYELDPTLYSVTSTTFIGSIFSLFGLTNVADPADSDGAKGGYPQMSQETLLKANPDMIFLADAKCCDQSPETVQARAGWSGISAVRTGQIVALDDDIASRWGPRVVDLARSIADALASVPA